MWIGFTLFDLVGLFVSSNALLAAVAILVRRKKQPGRLRARFAAILITTSYLLIAFILINAGLLQYTGVVKLTHDMSALLLAALILDYVLVALRNEQQRLYLYLPVLFYLLLHLSVGENFSSRISVPELVLILAFYSFSAGLVYILPWASLLISGDFPKRVANSEAVKRHKRHSNVEILLLTAIPVCVFQLVYLAQLGSDYLFWMAPSFALLLLALFFASFFFQPKSIEFLVESLSVDFAPKNTLLLAPVILTVNENELYLDNELSLEKLAGQVNLKPRELSQLLNQEGGNSFNEFISSFRITHAKQLLSNPNEAQTSIEAVALMSGFKSRSAFYEAFRRGTGQSPGEFRKSRP